MKNKGVLPKKVFVFNVMVILYCLSKVCMRKNGCCQTSGGNYQTTTPQPMQATKSNRILNEVSFGPLRNDSVVIIVQVHNRIIYLKEFINSLSRVTHISDVLLIFSHDYYDENINNLVQNITFCKVIQIFYPYSIQKYQHEFPGPNPNDCSPEIIRDGAIIGNCSLRFAEKTQLKHHWWWKINHVFDHLYATRYYTGPVMFLEEDHYVAEDVLYVLKLMQKQAPQMCPMCSVFVLGNHVQLAYFNFSKSDKVDVLAWQHNMGFAINRTVWNEIVKCNKVFCTYTDDNWDFTFRYISQQCLPNVLATMVVEMPRVFHIGECGVHTKNNDCDPHLTISKINQFQQNVSELHKMYPNELKLATMSLVFQNFQSNGYWSDSRDHELCTSFGRIET